MEQKRTEIMERLREILLAADDRNREAVEACGDDTRLIADLGFSSVSMLYMVIAIEEEFGIAFIIKAKWQNSIELLDTEIQYMVDNLK